MHGSLIATMFIIFIGYINFSYLAPCFYIIIVFFENVVDINIVLFVLVIIYVFLIIVIYFLFLVLLVYFKGNYGCLSDLLFTNASYRCNRSLFRLRLLSFLAFLHLCVVVFLLLLGFLMIISFIIEAVFVFDVATIVNLYWLRVYYR